MKTFLISAEIPILLLLLFIVICCTQSSTDSYLKHQRSIILHDGNGRTFVATHIDGDKWELRQ